MSMSKSLYSRMEPPKEMLPTVPAKLPQMAKAYP
jgi:hypothetical protein